MTTSVSRRSASDAFDLSGFFFFGSRSLIPILPGRPLTSPRPLYVFYPRFCRPRIHTPKKPPVRDTPAGTHLRGLDSQHDALVGCAVRRAALLGLMFADLRVPCPQLPNHQRHNMRQRLEKVSFPRLWPKATRLLGSVAFSIHSSMKQFIHPPDLPLSPLLTCCPGFLN